MTEAVADRRPRLHSPWTRLRVRLRRLYHGQSRGAVRFRLGVIAVDLVLIAFFIAAPLLRPTPFYFAIDYTLAAVLGLDLGARALSRSSLLKWLRQPIVWIDLFVFATLLFPGFFLNLAFLRILRLWTLLHSEFFWGTFGRTFQNTRWEEATKASITLLTFIFIVTGVVYTSFAGRGVGINGYVDALYFTIAALTTTGFGDIVLPGTWGKLVSIVTMLAGITLFVRLAQALFRPHKVRHECPSCGLIRHEPDAVHCKACGIVLHIPNDQD